LQRRNHRNRRNIEGSDDEGRQKQRAQARDDEGIEILADDKSGRRLIVVGRLGEESEGDSGDRKDQDQPE